ncbi:MAG: prepilin-type N-terminal cleavage/methylation domain-containing protein [Deltaproteobacteria bacterium]|nr:prepilin-type N-terminal cleavage/methylation domain-containing protein [Deltaproteobacteria bacterium]
MRTTDKSAGGFTLLELLISMSLLVVIVSITMGAMRMGSRAIAAGEKRMDGQERFRTVLSIMDAQIQSQVPLSYDEGGNKKYRFRGDGKSLRLSTNYSIWDGRRGYVMVDYRVETDDAGNEILYASEQVPGIEGRRESRLIDAAAISFDYFYKDPTEEQGKWVETLSEGTVIPERIRLRVKRKPENFSLIFPVRVRGAMTQVQGGALK